jgi:hypothetical protein
MNKNELEYKKAVISANRFSSGAKTVRHIASIVGGLFAIKLAFDGLNQVLGGLGADEISATAKVIEALDLGSIVLFAWGGTASVAWWRERKGKQRIIGEKSKLQSLVEETDPNRTSSGLTETGGTPLGDA